MTSAGRTIVGRKGAAFALNATPFARMARMTSYRTTDRGPRTRGPGLTFTCRSITFAGNDDVSVSGARALHLARHSKPLPVDLRQSSALPGKVGPRSRRLAARSAAVLVHRSADGQAGGGGARKGHGAARHPARAARRASGAARARLPARARRGDTPRAKVVSLPARPEQATVSAARSISPGASASCDASLEAYVGSDPQRALAAKYFAEGSRLDDGDGRKMEEAAAAYRKALVVDPDLVPAVVNLANIHYARDEVIEAQALYERAIALDPECFEAHFNLGNIHHDLGRYRRALVCYRDAVALNPATPTRISIWPSRWRRPGSQPRPSRTGARTSSSRRTASGRSWRASFRNRRTGKTGTRDKGLRPFCQTGVSTCNPPARASSGCAAACRTRNPGTRIRRRILPCRRTAARRGGCRTRRLPASPASGRI